MQLSVVRSLLVILSLAVLCPVQAPAAESYPTHPIRLIVPFPAGGIADLSGRLIAERLREKLNQPVIVENKAGANGVLGYHELIKAEPDGYTLMMGTVGSVVINIVMDPKPPFDPLHDLAPIANAAEYATALVVNNQMPVNSLKEFVDYAKARPGKLSFGSTGVGALDYTAAQLLMKETGISMVHVPYKGGPGALNDLIGGSIDVIVEVFPVVMQQIKAHTIKGLAVTSPYRQPTLPDVPTFKESGFGGVELTGWLGLYGPPHMPEDVRQMLGKMIAEIVKEPAMAEKFRAIGFEPTGQDADTFAAYHAAEVKRWKQFTGEMGMGK
jgi:tripartite-type tricarboxylate transporter receptor subunit TctC